MDDYPESFRRRFEEDVQNTQAARGRVLAALKAGTDPEPDKVRSAAFTARRVAAVAPELPAELAESVVGDDDMQAAWFLPVGAQARRAVAIVRVRFGNAAVQGSGFLVSPRLFLTNYHVLGGDEVASTATVTFDYETGVDGKPLPTTTYKLDPSAFSQYSPLVDGLDYALVALGELIDGSATVDELGYFVLSNSPDRHKLGLPANVIEHPLGSPKLIAIRSNLLQARTPTTLLYSSDTDHGASGCPVCNDEWQVIALHHYGSPYLSQVDEDGKKIDQHLNEGIRISAIYNDLSGRLPTLAATKQQLLFDALQYSLAQPSQADGGPALSEPGQHSAEAAVRRDASSMGVAMGATTYRGTAMTQDRPDGITINVPLEITVRVRDAYRPTTSAPVISSPTASGIGGPATDSVAPTSRSSRQPTLSAPTLRPAAESVVVDTDYSNRQGYSPDFIEGVSLPFPKLIHGSDKPLEFGAHQSTELKYTHYSVVLSTKWKMALFTATNLDGNTFRKVDRATGQVADSQEGDKWYVDPRVPESSVLEQDFYSAWSTYFDRGHLTRREDANWGDSDDESERGNADTFHFTNCTPQHFRFNESTKYWQGVERYVLENGTLRKGNQSRLCIFQGPIFGASDRSAGKVQIPSRFFKVVVWKGHDGELKSVGFIVDQSALLSEKRVSLGKPPDTANINIQQYRVAIAEVERESGLDFGKPVRDADTFELDQAPGAGEAFAAISLRSDSDILPADAKRAER